MKLDPLTQNTSSSSSLAASTPTTSHHQQYQYHIELLDCITIPNYPVMSCESIIYYNQSLQPPDSHESQPQILQNDNNSHTYNSHSHSHSKVDGGNDDKVDILVDTCLQSQPRHQPKRHQQQRQQFKRSLQVFCAGGDNKIQSFIGNPVHVVELKLCNL